jgi:NAD(P)-dependent dehydrogenase (short-subunit alcohol dehydrogenase family)
MPRTYLVTGSASGIGHATAELLRDRGETVIGVDLRDAEISVDLTTAEGRAEIASAARELSHGTLDGVLAVAGVSALAPVTVAMNYFGTLATLNGLRPLLARSAAPRAVAVSSMVSLFPTDDDLVALMTAEDEPAALARAAELATNEAEANLLYPSTKKALAQWVRRTAPTPDWAGAGIALNAIAPGVINTPMSAEMLATEQGRQTISDGVPMPLNGFAEPAAPAHLLAWLASEENTHLCGQVIFIDGGSEVLARGDAVW